MTKKKNLTAFMIAIIVMLFSLPANAQGTVGYAQYNTISKTLTFKGGTSVPDGAFALNTGIDEPAWNSVKNSCTKVKFDASFNDVRPTSCCFWFREFSNLSTIEGIGYLNTDNVTNMYAMFYDCSKLTSTSLDVSKFNTANVTDMSYMFFGCSSLTSLDVSNFNTAKVTHMTFMFNRCSGLTSLDLSSFNTAKVVSMYTMFFGCSGLTSLDLSSFNTAKVTNMGNMFNRCSGLTSLDLSSFNTANVTKMDYMFYGCKSLTKIYVSDDFTIGNVTDGSYMFTGCASLKGAVSYNSGNTGIDMANFDGYFTKSNLTPYVKWNGDTKVLTFKVANYNYTEGTEGEWKFNEGAIDLEGVKNNCKKVVFTPSFKQVKPTSCYKWFSGFGQLTTIQGIENLNTEKVTNMSEMFNSCSGLTSLDLSSFNTAEVTDMFFMFNGCSGLTTIYASDDFTTGIVTKSTGMFENCTNLKGAVAYDSNKIVHSMANYKTGYFKTYFALGGSKVELFGESTSLDLSGDNDFVAHAPFTVNKAT